MKLKYEFVSTKVDDEYMAVPVGEKSENFKAVLKLNETAKDVMELLQNEIGEEELLKKMSEMYEGDNREDILRFIDVLRKNNILEE